MKGIPVAGEVGVVCVDRFEKRREGRAGTVQVRTVVLSPDHTLDSPGDL